MDLFKVSFLSPFLKQDVEGECGCEKGVGPHVFQIVIAGPI